MCGVRLIHTDQAVGSQRSASGERTARTDVRAAVAAGADVLAGRGGRRALRVLLRHAGARSAVRGEHAGGKVSASVRGISVGRTGVGHDALGAHLCRI